MNNGGPVRDVLRLEPWQWLIRWDNAIGPVRTVNDGDSLSFELPDSSGGMITPYTTSSDLSSLQFAPNPLVGPVCVHGVEPGDALAVTIEKVEVAGQWGWSAAYPDFGLLKIAFPRADLFPRYHLQHWTIDGGECIMRDRPDIRVPLRPFCGEIGVAPRDVGGLSTIPPGSHGGNIDCRYMTEGTTVYFPVFAEGALFCCGDGHAAQGDGEVNGTGIEVPLHVTLTFERMARANLSEICFERAPGKCLTPDADPGGWYATMACGPDVQENARTATRSLVEALVCAYDLEPEQAYCLCGAAADLKIAQVVNEPRFTVSAHLPLGIFRHDNGRNLLHWRRSGRRGREPQGSGGSTRVPFVPTKTAEEHARDLLRKRVVAGAQLVDERMASLLGGERGPQLLILRGHPSDEDEAKGLRRLEQLAKEHGCGYTIESAVAFVAITEHDAVAGRLEERDDLQEWWAPPLILLCGMRTVADEYLMHPDTAVRINHKQQRIWPCADKFEPAQFDLLAKEDNLTEAFGGVKALLERMEARFCVISEANEEGKWKGLLCEWCGEETLTLVKVFANVARDQKGHCVVVLTVDMPLEPTSQYRQFAVYTDQAFKAWLVARLQRSGGGTDKGSDPVHRAIDSYDRIRSYFNRRH